MKMEEPLNMEKLEELLSNSQIKTQFFGLGYGIFNVYLRAYKNYGNFYDPLDPTGKRYGDFREADDDIRYINGKNGGRALLRYWFDMNRDYVDKRLFGNHYKKVKHLESMLIDNRLLQDFVYNELVVEFLANVNSDGISVKYDFGGSTDGKSRLLSSYVEALESVYRLYIQKALN